MSTSTHPGIGETLQRVRRERGLSLRTLASRAGFSPSFVSQVENGQTSPSIASLEKLAANLDLRLVDFFGELASSHEPTESTRRRQLESAWSRSSVEPVLPRDALQRLDALEITIASGGRSGKKPSPAWSEQLVYVIEGRLTLELEGRALELGPGNAAAIPLGRPYRWQNDGEERARVLLVSVR